MARPKILLVDDTRLVLELEKSYLKFSDVDVITAGNGLQALELIRKDPPDLIFMDMNMPDMDGISCCAALKADVFLCDIPVIMLTTAGREEDRERAAKAGCNGYLTKPVDRREFLATARKYTSSVDRRQLRIACHLPVLLLDGKEPVGAYTVDMSDCGVYLTTHHAVTTDAQLKVALYLPGQPSLLEMSARVAWVNDDKHRVKPSLPIGFGVEFLDLSDRLGDALNAFLATQNDGASCDGTP